MDGIQMLFLREVVPAAIASMKQSGVPASVTVAQAILESGWGRSWLALEANNYFGIKAEHLDDPETYVDARTREFVNGQPETVDAKFEKYLTPAACFVAHATLLSQAKRYAPAMAAKADAEKFAEQLMVCGYSTNRPPLAAKPPYYADELIGLMRQYDLTQYDVQQAS